MRTSIFPLFSTINYANKDFTGSQGALFIPKNPCIGRKSVIGKFIHIMGATSSVRNPPDTGNVSSGMDEIRLGKIFSRLKEMERLEEEVERKDYLLQALYELIRELNALENSEAIYQALLSSSVGIFGSSIGSVLLYDARSKELSTYLERGHATGIAFPLDDKTLMLFSSINFPVIPEKKEDEIGFFRDHKRDIIKIGGEVWVPLVGRLGELRGILCLGPRLSGRPYSSDDLLLLSMLAGSIMQAINNKEANTELKDTVKNLTVINEVDTIMHSSVDTTALYHLLLEALIHTMEASSAAFLSLDGAGNPVVEKVLGEGLDLISNNEGQVVISEAIRISASRGISILYPDPSSEISVSTKLLSFLSVPLVHGEKVLGAIIIARAQGGRVFEPAELRLLKFVASQISISLENRRLLFDYLSQKKETFKVRGLFEQYLSPQLVDELLNRQGSLPIGGQKKDLTILIADIRKFVNISEQLSSEELVDLLSRFYTQMVKVILRGKGIVDKFMGDAVMAIFGAPIGNIEYALSDTERAVLVAVEMQYDFKILAEEWNAHWNRNILMELGIGVCSGNVFIGNIGSYHRMEYTVIGREVNLAARLSSLAQGGQILIGESVYHAVKDTIFGRSLLPRESTGSTSYIMVKKKVPLTVKQMTPVRVKGLEREVIVYEVVY